MKQNIINLIVIISVLAISGQILMPHEQKLSEELLENQLIPQRLDLESRLALKQKGFASGFGSLRPTIAAFLFLAASNDHADQDWIGLEEKFQDIVMLDPHNPYYWDQASWHLISNASSDNLNNEEIPFLTRYKLYQEYIDKGEAIIAKGIELNPNSRSINKLSPKHYSSKFRRPNYAKAVDEYARVAQMEGFKEGDRLFMLRARVYSLNKLPERHQEAYDSALKLFHENPRNHLPALLTTVFVGQNHPLNKVDKKYTLEEIFGSKRDAYKALKIQWKYKNPLESRYGIETTLRQLENELRVKQDKRLFPLGPLK